MPLPPPPPARGPTRWSLVLPVKGGPAAKTRLGGSPDARRRLALAMALDCLDAVLAAPGVERALVVTGDAEVASPAAAAGALVVAPSAAGDRPPLDAAVADGVRACVHLSLDRRPAPREHAAAVHGVAVLLADVPALRPQELADALTAAGRALDDGAPAALVPDATGTGTALLVVAHASALRTAYGEGSAARHERLGARRLELALPGLRRDVDTPQDLRDAVALGLGPRTSAALDEAGALRATG